MLKSTKKVETKASFLLGGIFCADEIFSLSYGFQVELIRKKQRKNFLLAENSAKWKSGLRKAYTFATSLEPNSAFYLVWQIIPPSIYFHHKKLIR